MAVVSSETLHASAVAIDGRAVLIEGPSGAGKSDLALRLIDRGAMLIADDYTLLMRTGAELVARVPATAIAGRIEVRGLGIVALPHVDDVPLGLIVRLADPVPRMPERRRRIVAGIQVREIAFEPFHASTAIRIELALRQPEATPA